MAAREAANIGVLKGLTEIYAHVSAGRRREFAALLGLMALGALAELGTIGSVIPFLSLLSGQASGSLPSLASAFSSLGGLFGGDALAGAALVFGAMAVAAGLIRLELGWLTQHFVYCLGHEIALESQRRILLQPYSFHIGHNSSELVAVTAKAEILVFDLVLPLMQTIISASIAAVLIMGLLYIDPFTTLAASSAFVLIYLLVTAFISRRLAVNSQIVGSSYEQRIKVLQETLGGIRDVIIDNGEAERLKLFESVNARLGRARATTNFMATAPRFAVEALGMVVIAAMVVVVSRRSGGIAVALPLLGAFALGAQRLLPLVQTVYAGWSLATGHRSIVGQVIEILRLPLPPETKALSPLALRTAITVDNISFAYPGRPNTLAIANLSFDIPRGAMVALTGKSGSGKSTLADLLTALLEPNGGRICVDGTPLSSENARRWQRNIAHVSQSIFLADSSVAHNIALSLPHDLPDQDRIVDAAKKAQLHDFIVTLPSGYETHVGELGIRLSGGQRQRLGIARAIYKDAPVLVLDEATSALDELTEKAVIGALEELRSQGRTIIIIAHRRSTIRHCDPVVRLEDGRLVGCGTFEQIVREQENAA
jgi:ATP-binding cassette subfamily B protein